MAVWVRNEVQLQGAGGWGCLGGSAVERLLSAQGVIPESQDRVPHWVTCEEPASPSAWVSASLSASLMNK